MWYLYILECKDGSYYTGITKDIHNRIERHNAGTGAKYTRSHRPVKLVYFAEYEIESEVRSREIEIKGWPRKRKTRLVLEFPSSVLKDFLRISGQ